LQQLLTVGCKTNGIHACSIREASGSVQHSTFLARRLKTCGACEGSQISYDGPGATRRVPLLWDPKQVWYALLIGDEWLKGKRLLLRLAARFVLARRTLASRR
jgi:hypothetical protein